MARIELVDLAHSYAPAGADGVASWALKPMTMTWDDGGAYALLGPSGCGKSTLLNLISGLLIPTRGRILFDGVDVTTAPPQQRNIAQVFQFPVIYDSMTVRENLEFPLRNRGWGAAAARRRAEQIGEMLELTTELDRRASGLGADLKQKISLGRGLVRTDVAAVLFDEPLTVIDPHLKWLLRRKLKQIHHELRLSLIYVTHDQTEAMTFADRIVVMTQGEVVQEATPAELFERPAHRFVGYFIGSPGMNFIPAEWHDGMARVAGVPVATQSRKHSPSASPVIGVRPEQLEARTAPGPNSVPARILDIQDLGTHVIGILDVAGTRVRARLPDAATAATLTHLHIPPERSALYVDDWRLE
ncbi:MAG: ABC transporter ATP-binding protein [Pseudomonadota bacterium]